MVEPPKPRPPQQPGKRIFKGIGTTDSERRLAHLCGRTFLGLWSWPNVHRDDSKKEICDLLVVFGSHIVIFSDKQCAFKDTGNTELDWTRWFRGAVSKAAAQAGGAERWIRANPDRIFTDATCSTRVPFDIQIDSQTVIHRVVVARGAADRILREFGGSGSLLIDSGLVGAGHLPGGVGFRPFTIGNLHPAKGFVHVFDEAAFEVLLDVLDTADDFIRYLLKRRDLFEGPVRTIACGEEDLLARYLRGLDPDGQHGFRVPQGFDAWVLDEGEWRAFESHPERLAQQKANEISYLWDDLIEEFVAHQLQGTALPGGSALNQIELPLRVMASECRTHRRLLSKALRGALEAGDRTDRMIRLSKGKPGEAAYLFMTLKHLPHLNKEEYRILRRGLLEGAITIARVDAAPDASGVVGIATEPRGRREDLRSEDLAFIDAPVDDELKDLSAKYKRELKMLEDPAKQRSLQMHEAEYPLHQQRSSVKGHLRNKPCQCGSGKKAKRCCGRPR